MHAGLPNAMSFRPQNGHARKSGAASPSMSKGAPQLTHLKSVGVIALLQYSHFRSFIPLRLQMLSEQIERNNTFLVAIIRVRLGLAQFLDSLTPKFGGL